MEAGFTAEKGKILQAVFGQMFCSDFARLDVVGNDSRDPW